LEDGRRVILHDERGFTLGRRSSGEPGSSDAQGRETLESLTRDVLNVVLPDDDAVRGGTPLVVAGRPRSVRGLHVTAEDLRGLPYEVIFAENVRRWLSLTEADEGGTSRRRRGCS
jgi:hypothetical protein